MQSYSSKGDHQKEVGITYLTVGGTNLESDLGKSCERMDMGDTVLHMSFFEAQETVRDPSEFRAMLRTADESDLFIINCHGDPSGYKRYDRLRDHLGENGVNTFVLCQIQESMREARGLFLSGDEAYIRILTYFQLGGPENRSALLRYICSLFGSSVEVPPPRRERMQGIYHPDCPRDITREEYVGRLDPSRPTVGVLIQQSAWVNGSLEPQDLLIQDIELLGANVLPVFMAPTPSEITGAIGGREVFRTYLHEGDRRIVDSLVLAGFGFSFLSLCNPTDGSFRPGNILQELGVPALSCTGIFRPQAEWEADGIGMEGGELAISVAMPELDGQLTTVPFTFIERDSEGHEHCGFREDRVMRIAQMAVRWARVGRVPVSERRVSILFNGGTLSNASIGAAGGLDSFASACNLLRRMAEEGYSIDHVPESGQEIVDEMLNALTNNLEWVDESEIGARAADLVDNDIYKGWASETDGSHFEWVCRDWGEPPGEIMTHVGRFIVPGVRNGNVYLGLEPNRGKHDKAEQLIHDPDLSPPHQYLAYYRWISRVFATDVHVHIGTHGSCEWLPGKGNGLSSGCSPDIMMEDMPHLYAYVIDDPSEGIVAKRRKKAVLVDHMMPSLTRAGTYDELMELEGQLQQYLFCKQTMQSAKMEEVGDSIMEALAKLSMWKELGLSEDATREDVLPRCEEVFDYVTDLKDGLITDGLHIMGQVPEGRRLEEMVYCLTRLRNGKVPSLRGAVARAEGFDLDRLLDDMSGFTDGELNGTIVDRIDGEVQELISSMQGLGYDPDACRDLVGRRFRGDEDMTVLSDFITRDIIPGIHGITDEIGNMVAGMRGGYVPPGPSGSPTRSGAHLLPTGRNYYSLDPETVPTQESWKVGVRMADDMIRSYIEREGKYPESVGIVVWSVDTMKTGGDDTAYILYLLGVRPVWGSSGGKVTGLEIMSREEMGRPRIDVTVRISSLFRDTFPNLFQLIDEAVEMVADLDESEEDNYIRKHLREDIADLIEGGMMPAEAREQAMIRVFGEPPGTHGAGVNILVESSKWDSVEDLAQIYVTCGCSAYGRRWRGERRPDLFRRRIEGLDVAVKNQVDREFDLIDTDDGYSYLGGMNAVCRAAGIERPVNYVGDSSDPDRIRTRDLEGEMAYILRTRILNPKWLDGLKEHGFVGANLVHDNINHAYGLDATSDVIEDWMYEAMADRFLFDESNRSWLGESNPFALRDILDDLLEAIDRGLWDASNDTRERLRDLYLEAEGLLEEDAASRRSESRI